MTRFSIGNEIQPRRQSTPVFDKNAPYLLNNYCQPEGIYVCEAWPLEARARMSFQFFHHDQFDPPLVLHEQNFSTPEETQEWWVANRYYVYQHKMKLDPDKKYCTPVIERDARIKKEQEELGWVADTGVRRVRNGKRYLVYLQFTYGNCEDWHVGHYHGCAVIILNDRDSIVYHEEYGCEAVWKGIQDYRFAIKNFDVVAMQFHL